MKVVRLTALSTGRLNPPEIFLVLISVRGWVHPRAIVRPEGLCQWKKVKVKQSHYTPGQALRVPGGWSSQISRQSAHESSKVVSPTHRPPLPQETFLVLISVRGWVHPRAVVWPEGLCQWKTPTPPSGIEPATFRLVVECLNQLRHQQRAPKTHTED